MRSFRLAVLALGLCIPQIAAACLPPPPPEPPPRAATESEAEFSARRVTWYREWSKGEQEKALPGLIADEDRAWATAKTVVRARVEKIGSTRLRGTEGQRYKSPLVTLRPIDWLKGRGTARRLRVHYLSDDSCDFGGAGDVPEGEVGEIFLLFYKEGLPTPRNIVTTIGERSAVTTRSREALGLGAEGGDKDGEVVAEGTPE